MELNQRKIMISTKSKNFIELTTPNNKPVVLHHKSIRRVMEAQAQNATTELSLDTHSSQLVKETMEYVLTMIAYCEGEDVDISVNALERFPPAPAPYVPKPIAPPTPVPQRRTPPGKKR
jgi:hypothetical protein